MDYLPMLCRGYDWCIYSATDSFIDYEETTTYLNCIANMSNLDSSEGHYIAFSGNFDTAQSTLQNRFKKFRVFPASSNNRFTILAATKVEYNKPSKDVQEARNRNLFILNERWVSDCCEEKKWIPPKECPYLAERRSRYQERKPHH